ncbi:dual oxidase maturation factor 1-like [Diorhabda carinulata]|uniref:dual oxidase maturation factor 1-like n=1 Tax=Diorhabda carinulata TaxID=1163345 RepID=UPI0025A01396|nr:dual oxidase maturation factor 1-like [Diorhabda carinulata]XP_057665330.1 dual oxidase maturation factor 1-like [Diorhabda carinulata]XP_057665331.1 dual oxidase maturation factor 1-like [Diorhabda carinulata]
MKGWFDAFRYDGGPTLYNFHNRTSVTGDVTFITFLATFTTLYVAFLIIYFGIRKERCSTFCAVTLSLFIGATILITLYGSAWHISKSSIVSTYQAFSKEQLTADIGVYVGLNHVNITLQANSSNIWSDIDFNEQFVWKDAHQMHTSFREAIIKGLPFPILTVAEYFTTGQEGLAWGRQYRTAGYFAIIMLWTSFVTWVLMNLMLIVVPRYGALLMTLCGILLLSTVCGYFGMLPEPPLVIYVEGTKINFSFGWCYWLVLTAGGICLLAGVIITTVEIINPHSFSTILEVDYDTPFDRHIIIEDSRGKRFEKKKTDTNLESPNSLGKILRRLNSKNRDEDNENIHNVSKSNQEFRLEPSPWKYPYKKDPSPSISIISSTVSIPASTESPVYKNDLRYVHRPNKIDSVSMW